MAGEQQDACFAPEGRADATAGEAATCTVFLPRKQRWCRFPRVAGSPCCVHHTGSAAAAPAGDCARVPCPLDPRHSVRKDELERHLRKCNRTKERQQLESQPWFRRDLHAFNPGAVGADASARPEKAARAHAPPPPPPPPTVAELRALLDRIALAHATLGGDELREAAAPAPQPTGKLGSSERHRVQCDAIASHPLLRGGGAGATEAEALTGPATAAVGPAAASAVHVEFGAGTAQLSASLAARRDAGAQLSFVLIDTIVPRNKADGSLTERARDAPGRTGSMGVDGGQASGLAVTRLKGNIKDVDLVAVAALRWGTRATRRVASAKHLCGSGTDYALRCLAACGPGAFDGAVLATCCHHRCSWPAFANTEQLVAWGFGEGTFRWLCAVACWAVDGGGRQNQAARSAAGDGRTCGLEADDDAEGGAAEEPRAPCECDEHGGAGASTSVLGRAAAELELDPASRAGHGVRAKELLDVARARLLRASGYRAHVERGFVDVGVSPENRLLCAAGIRSAHALPVGVSHEPPS